MVVRVRRAVAYVEMRTVQIAVAGIVLVALILIVFVGMGSVRRLVSRLETANTRTANLRVQLFNAAKLASVGEMAAGVAHEINNPLAIVYEESALMRDILDPAFGQTLDLDDFRERLDSIMGATMRGRDITRKLLAFARRHDPEPEPTDLNDLVRRVIDVKSRSFGVSNVEVLPELTDDLPPALINANQMEQVILNLFNNARDAFEGGGRITVRTARDGAAIRLEVEDDGSGMSPEVMEQIFFPFYTTKGVGKGTGLGLSISYGIIKAFGGRIEVKSEEGVGTTFSLWVPTASGATRKT